jgi:hypothetical protein
MSNDEFTFDDAMHLRGLDPEEIRRNLEDKGPEPTTWYVDIVEDATGEVLEHMGPMTEHEADQTQRGASINLNHAMYSVVKREAS